MVKCAVRGCTNYQGKKENGKSIRFFCFPKNAKQTADWIRVCGSDDSLNLKVARVCSEHFTENDFKLQHVLLNIPEDKRKLKPGAIPSIGVLSEGRLRAHREHSEKEKHKKLVEEAISQYNRKYVMEISDHFSEPEVYAPSASSKGSKFEPEDPLAGPTPQSDHLRRENKELAMHIKKLKKRLQLAETAIASMEEIFTEGQIKRVKNPNKTFKWSFDDISFAACLYAAGPLAYSMLMKKNYPLPAPASLKKWATNIKLKPGLIHSTLNCMSNMRYPEMERLCILSFHEIRLKPSVQDESNEIQAHYKMVHTVIARGLIPDWKQVVYYNYDCENPGVFLNEIVQALKEIHFTVVAIVSGVGHLNLPLWPEMKVDHNRPYVEFVTGEKVFFFGNVPHLIRDFRNCFVKYGITMGDKHVTTAPIRELLKPNMPDLELGFKLSEPHISSKKDARQNAELTYQLLSEPLAIALRKCILNGTIMSPYALECSDIIQLFSDWWEIFNSKDIANDGVEALPPYGLALGEQDTIISLMNNLMRKITKCGRKATFSFQRGILLNNASLKQLQSYLLEKYRINYVITNRFNQNDLEHLFKIKRSGTNFSCKPTALEFKYRINSIVLRCLGEIKNANQ